MDAADVVPPVLFDFDASGPTMTDQISDYFTVLGFDGGWAIDANTQDPDNRTNALHTVSDGEQLANYFSRVLILAGLELEDGEVGASITWDDEGGDANDHAGLYFRFNGESDDPHGNEYYFLRMDAADAVGGTSGVSLHRVRDGGEETVFQVDDDPITIGEGDTAAVNVVFDGPNITVTINGAPVTGMNPFIDPDPLLGPGRVGVGQNANPAYFDDLRVRPAILLDCDASITYFKGTEEPSPAADGSATTDWTRVDFDDSAWLSGQLGIGFGDGDDVTVLDDMENNYSTFYVRVPFFMLAGNLPTGATFLRADWDDGFVAYLNGVEVVRTDGIAGMPPPFDGSSEGHGASERSDPCSVIDDGHDDVEDFLVDTNLLQEGENVLAVHVHNSSLDSSDTTFLAKLFHETDVCIRDLACVYDVEDCATILTWEDKLAADAITIVRNGETIAEIAGDLDEYIDPHPPTGESVYEVTATIGGRPCPTLTCSAVAGAVIPIVVEGEEWSFFRGREEPSPAADGSATTAWTESGFDVSAWETGPSGFGYDDDDDRTVLEDMENGYVSVYVRKTIDIPAELLAERAELVIVVTYDDSYVCYVGGVEVDRSADDLVGVPPAFDAEPAESSSETKSFSVDPSLLVVGGNVVALQGHNSDIDPSDFSLIPEVFAVLATPNQAPAAVISVQPAGDVVLSGGVAQATLNGSGSTEDGLGCGGLGYGWTKVSGPEGDRLLTPDAASTVVTFTQSGAYEYELAVDDGRDTGTAVVAVTVVSSGGAVVARVPGDANGDGDLNVSDVLYIATLLFVNPALPLPCGGPPEAFDQGSNRAVLDFNGDMRVNLSDIVASASWQFAGGSAHPLNTAAGGPGCALLADCGVDQCAP